MLLDKLSAPVTCASCLAADTSITVNTARYVVPCRVRWCWFCRQTARACVVFVSVSEHNSFSRVTARYYLCFILLHDADYSISLSFPWRRAATAYTEAYLPYFRQSIVSMQPYAACTSCAPSRFMYAGTGKCTMRDGLT
ncbi:hypothetical protein TRVL_06855 [Trypanosoma vivax]|nr:hypothetical protein TRVL_06855 [Trypanosoma vivax]